MELRAGAVRPYGLAAVVAVAVAALVRVLTLPLPAGTRVLEAVLCLLINLF
jgi:hypothetical protein